MAVEIPIKVVNQTSAGLNQIKQDVAKVTDATDKLEKEYKEAEKAAESLGKRTKDGFLKITTGISATVDAGRALIDGLRAVGDGIQAAADSGSPAFQRLQGEINAVKASLVALADDPALQRLADNLGDLIRDTRGETKDLGDVARGVFDNYRRVGVGIFQTIGLLADDTSSKLERVINFEHQANDILKDRIARERELLKLRQQQQEVQELFKQGEQALAQQEFAHAIQKIKNQNEVLVLIERERERLQESIKEGRLSDKEKESAMQRVMTLQSRLGSLRIEQAEQAEKAEQQAADQRRKQLDDERKAAQKLKDERLAAYYDEQDKKLAAFKEHQQKLKEAEKQATQEKADLLKPGLEQVRGGFNDRQVFEQIVKQRTAGMNEKDALATRREAFRNRGQIGADEIEGARDNLLRDTINQARQSGQLDTQTAHALQQAQKQMQAEREGAQKNQQMLQEVAKQLGDTLQATVKGQQETQRLQNLIDSLKQQVEGVQQNANTLQQQSPAQRARVSRTGG